MSGYIFLWRNIRDKQLLYSRPFCPLGAWVDMLMMTNWKDKTWCGEVIERGSFVTSQPRLAKRWGWTRSKVQRFLANLQIEQRIEQLTNSRRTKIRITNYEQYQSISPIGEQPMGSVPDRKPDNRSGTTKELYKNKEGGGAPTAPSVEQIQNAVKSLSAKYGDACARDYAQVVLSHFHAKGSYPVNFEARVEKWLLEDKMKGQGFFSKENTPLSTERSTRRRPELRIFRAQRKKQ